jgi:hypothetical protein
MDTFLLPRIPSQNQHLSQRDVGLLYLTLRKPNLVTYPRNAKVPVSLDKGVTSINSSS